MDPGREKVFVQGVEAQVVLVIRVPLPHLVKEDHKLH